jgi:hypothetical protein
MPGRYILKDGVPVPEPDLLTWAKWLEDDDHRRVALTEVGEARISTVFLGLDHSFGGGAPVLFETMVFGGELDEHCQRYYTLEEAMIGHERIVAVVRANKASS